MHSAVIGVVTFPGHQHCLDEFLDSLRAQTGTPDVLIVVNHGHSAYAKLIETKTMNDERFIVLEDPEPGETRIEKILSGRNYIRKFALKKGYNYLFMVDSDIILPPNAAMLLMASKEDVVSGAYLNNFELGGKNVIAPVLFKDLGNGECQLYTYEGAAVPKLFEIGAAGFGCTLISKKVLEAVEFRKLGNSPSGGEDIAFYVDARAKGFKTFANTFVKCTHRAYPKEDIRARAYEWKKIVEDEQVFNVNVKNDN